MENPIVFGRKTFQDLLKDIYNNSKEKRDQLERMMDELAIIVKNSNSPNAASLVVPLYAELLEVSVKNDEHLVKMATIIQRLMSATAAAKHGSLDTILSEEEKQKLLEEAANFKTVLDELNIEMQKAVEEEEKVDDLGKRTEKIVKQIETKSA